MKNPAIFTIPKKTMDFFEVTGGFRLVEPPARRGKNSLMDQLLKRPAREPWPLAWRACGLEGTEEVSTLFRKI
ncbi:MAG: hypothetical protein R6T98_00775 [Desulfatiglandales bacterium]